MKVTYALNRDNEFSIHYEAVTDKTTIVNLTNHSYFNLSGDLKTDVQGHVLTLKSDEYLGLDEDLMPLGELADVEGTPFDFRAGREIRSGVESNDPQNILAGNGYDHPFVIRENREQEIKLVCPENGRTLTIETDEPSVVVYTANQLGDEGEIYGVPARKYLGICLETQGYPDAIHQSNFPSCILKEGETFTSMTTYRFGVEK